MTRLEAIRALLEHRQPLLSTGLSHYPGCETEHIDCAAWRLLEVAEAAAAAQRNPIPALWGEAKTEAAALRGRLDGLLDKLTVEIPE